MILPNKAPESVPFNEIDIPMAPDVNGFEIHDTRSVSTGHHDLSNLIDSIPAMVASIDCNMVLRFANKPFKTWFSVKDPESGPSFPAIVGKQIFDQLQRHMGKVLVGSPAVFQISIKTEAENSFLYMDVTLSPELDEQKTVTGFVFYSTDITEKNKAERALRDYFENATIGLHWVNAEGIIIWANPAELEMFGYTENEYVGHHISEFHLKSNASEDILGRLSRNEILRNYETERLCKDGSTRLVAINSSVLWEGTKFIHTRCFTIDVTEQKLAEQAVRDSEERFKMMANLVPLVIWTTDENGDCNFLNVRWSEMTKKDIKEGLGNQWLNFIHADDKVNIQDSWLKSLSSKKPFEARFRYKDAEGGYTANYANARPRYNDSGDFIGYIGILQDISTQERIKSSLEQIVLERTEDLRKNNEALKAAENSLKVKNRELESINAELSSFAHVASHDLQEPLRKIQVFSNRVLSLEGHKFSERGKDLFNRIQTSSENMRALIQDLLAYSKAGNNINEKFEVVDLNLLFNEVVNELEIKIEEKKAVVESSELPKLSVIKFQFHQLFLNLLSNALKFSKDGTMPHIVVQSEVVQANQLPGSFSEMTGKYHHISVSDHGIGFEPEFNKKIFEIFYRLHLKRGFEGTGIGLAICKKIVENHHGIMTAEGKIGQGATFHIYLPA